MITLEKVFPSNKVIQIYKMINSTTLYSQEYPQDSKINRTTVLASITGLSGMDEVAGVARVAGESSTSGAAASYRRADARCAELPKMDKRSIYFFFGVAPLAVMGGWLVVALILTGDWTWQLPMGLLFSFVGSTMAALSTVFRF